MRHYQYMIQSDKVKNDHILNWINKIIAPEHRESLINTLEHMDLEHVLNDRDGEVYDSLPLFIQSLSNWYSHRDYPTISFGLAYTGFDQDNNPRFSLMIDGHTLNVVIKEVWPTSSFEGMAYIKIYTFDISTHTSPGEF